MTNITLTILGFAILFLSGFLYFLYSKTKRNDNQSKASSPQAAKNNSAVNHTDPSTQKCQCCPNCQCTKNCICCDNCDTCDNDILNNNNFSSSHVIMSQYLLKTEKDISQNIMLKSQKLLFRSSMMMQENDGVYSWLPLGLRVLNKIENIVTQNIETTGSLAILTPLTYISSSFYDDKVHNPVYKIIKHYSDNMSHLPITVHQIKTHHIKRVRQQFHSVHPNEYKSLDVYSFHASEKCFKTSYNTIRCAYKSLFKTLGINYRIEKKDENTQYIYSLNEDTPIKMGSLIKQDVQESSLKIKNTTLLSGHYEINFHALLAAIIEKNADNKGLVWPSCIAPFQVGIIAINANKSEQVAKHANEVYETLANAGIEVIYDDRNKSAGHMFADMDLIGIPHRLVISESTLAKNAIEYKHRTSNSIEYLNSNDILSEIQNKIKLT
jgi:prolyl-tRNA synthetase